MGIRQSKNESNRYMTLLENIKSEIYSVRHFIFAAILLLSSIYCFETYTNPTSHPDQCVDFNIVDEYVKITVYNPVPEQTHGNHLETADGTIIDPKRLMKSVAISRDLLDRFKMGDSIQVLCNCPYQGEYVINDKLSKRSRLQIDVLSHGTVGLFYGKIQKIGVEL